MDPFSVQGYPEHTGADIAGKSHKEWYELTKSFIGKKFSGAVNFYSTPKEFDGDISAEDISEATGEKFSSFPAGAARIAILDPNWKSIHVDEMGIIKDITVG